MRDNDKCPSCGSIETETVCEGESILNTCKVCREVRSKNWF